MPDTSAKPLRVRVIHWRAEEAGPLLEACRAAGLVVEYLAGRYPEIAREVRTTPPDAIVIDLSRLPSHGREVAIAFRNAKYSREIPLIFAGGAPEKVEAIRAQFTDAAFVPVNAVGGAVRKACRNRQRNPVVPVPMMERWGTRTTAQKLGIKEAMAVSVRNAPRDYAAVVGELPAGATLLEDPREICPITLWFVDDLGDYVGALPKMRKAAVRTKLWIIWRKGLKTEDRLTDGLVREGALEAGLVDYKICSLGPVWSGMLFAVKKA